MAVKFYCDVCMNEIKNGELTAELQMLDHDLSHKNNGQVVKTALLFCQNCKHEVKKSVIDLSLKKKNEKK